LTTILSIYLAARLRMRHSMKLSSRLPINTIDRSHLRPLIAFRYGHICSFCVTIERLRAFTYSR
jgi:hypothetical protein